MEGDSMLVIFKRSSKAISCAINMQKLLHNYNQDKPETDKVLLCVGIGFGEMLRIGDRDVFGAEVNASSKLGEDIAKAGEILVTGRAMKASGQFKESDFVKIDDTPPGADSAYRLIYQV
jgi:class 3 adenylate cyclase